VNGKNTRKIIQASLVGIGFPFSFSRLHMPNINPAPREYYIFARITQLSRLTKLKPTTGDTDVS
jgi:hypothetical protein